MKQFMFHPPTHVLNCHSCEWEQNTTSRPFFKVLAWYDFYNMKNIFTMVLGLTIFLFGAVSAANAQWSWTQGDYPVPLTPQQNMVIVNSPCSFNYDGWQCQKVQYGNTGYQFEIRYNLVGLTPTEHVVFAAGGYFGASGLTGSTMIQGALATKNYRSYDVQLIEEDANNPIYGSPNLSAMTAAVVQFISNNYAGGKKVKMIAHDYSATLVSYALAYRGLENKVNEVILVGGPAGFNFKYELYNPASPAYITAVDRTSVNDSMTVIDYIMWINGWDSIPPCSYLNWYWGWYFNVDGTSYYDDHRCEGQLELDSVSMFSDGDQPFSNVDLSYPGVEVHNIIGDADVKWFIDSSKYWYDKISPKVKTRDIIPGVDEMSYDSTDVSNKILERLGIVGVNLGAGSVLDATAPSKPTSITLQDKTTVLGGVTPPSVAIIPQGSVDNVAVHHYEVYRDGVYIGNAYPGVVFRDWNIAGETKYVYTVKAVDAGGNKSIVSDPSSVTTGKLPVNAAPAVSSDEIPWIESLATYQLAAGDTFSVFGYNILSCNDNKDGTTKSSLAVTHNIPANPAVGDVYEVTFNCTDSDGNKAAAVKSQVVIVAPNLPVVAPNPPANPNPPAVAQPPAAGGKPDLTWLYGAPQAGGAATPGGLVPCGDEGEPSCQFCHGIKLLENILDWLVKILTIIATIIFVYAGVRMATSVGDAAVKQAMKKLIINTVTGLVIVLAAWLFIDLLLQSFLDVTFQGPWNSIQCVNQPVPVT
jgi:hypothetical protein